MALTFSETAGVGVEDAASVREKIRQIFVDAFADAGSETELNTDPETPAGQLVDGMTALVTEKDTELLEMANGFNPKTATGLWQDALGEIYFIQRHVAQPTYVTCQCTGLQGTVIPSGAVVQDVNGNNYQSGVQTTIPSEGTVEVVFACQETGPIEAGAGTVNKIITVIPGWDSVNNATAGVVGRDRETQAEFEQRRYESVAKNSHGLAESVGGSVYNLDDVVACRIEQNRGDDPIDLLGVTIPGHSVYLSVYGGEPEEIGQIMHQKLDAGCGTAGNTSVRVTDETNQSQHTYYYTVAELKNLYVQVTTAKDAVYDEEAVTSSILSNFNGETADYSRAKMGDTVFASRFYQTAISAGLTDLVKIEIGRTPGTYGQSAAFNLDEMPVLDALNIVYVEEA